MTTTAEILNILATQKSPDMAEAIQSGLTNPYFRQQLLDGLTVKDDIYRYNCVKTVLAVCEEDPGQYLAQWDRFSAMLNAGNSYHRSIGMQILARLAAADTENRFETLFDRFFALLDDESFVTARQTAQAAGRLGDGRPDLRQQIAGKLLQVTGSHHHPERKELLYADVIQSLETLITGCADTRPLMAFAMARLKSSSPSTRKAAQSFLKKFGKENPAGS